MTEEELEQKAMDYEIDCIADVYKGDVCELQYAYSATKLEQAYIDGYAQGEQDLMASDTIVKKEFVDNLEKENAELKEQCSILADSNVSNDFFEEEEAQTYKHYIKIPFKGESPIYSTKQAAGADIALPKDVVVKAHSIVTWIDLEVGFDIPEGFCIMLQPRSSTSRKWHVLTDIGIIDSDYKLENIHCALINVTNEDIIIPKGTRIVQLLILPVYRATNWKCLNNIRDSKKGSGSTGN